MQTTIHNLSSVPCGALCIPIFVSSCDNTQGSDTAIELEQMAKLSVFIFALLAWTDCSCESIIIIIKSSKFPEYFKMHFKMCILK